jgi:hypothetical protein
VYVDRTAVAGVATFGGGDAGVAIRAVGNGYHLVAATQSFFASPFTALGLHVVVGAPARLLFNQQPGNSSSRQCLNGPPVVYVLDEAGNLVTGDNGTVVVLST